MAHRKEFGIIGLGRIGENLARQAIEKGMRVVGFTRSGAPADLLESGLDEIRSLDGFRKKLAQPRIVFIYIPPGPTIDRLLDELAAQLEQGDLLVDGGNSYWGDSVRRHSKIRARGFEFVDLGTSGGIAGARHGACFMAGGEAPALARIEPILRKLAVKGGFVHAGPPGPVTL